MATLNPTYYAVAEKDNDGYDSIVIYRNEQSAIQALQEEYEERTDKERTFTSIDEAINALNSDTDSTYFWTTSQVW